MPLTNVFDVVPIATTIPATTADLQQLQGAHSYYNSGNLVEVLNGKAIYRDYDGQLYITQYGSTEKGTRYAPPTIVPEVVPKVSPIRPRPKGIAETVQSLASGAYGEVKSLASGAVGEVKSLASGAYSEAKSIAESDTSKSILYTIEDVTKSGVTGVKSILEAPSDIKAAFSSPLTYVVAAGALFFVYKLLTSEQFGSNVQAAGKFAPLLL